MKLKTVALLSAGVLALAAFAPRPVPAPRPAAPAPHRAVHTVRMRMDGHNSKFDPATLTIHTGDEVRFVNVSGGPHNISFDPATLPADVRRALDAAMADQIQPLWGRLLVNANDTYTISFAGVRPGRYEYFCVPHMYDSNGGTAMGMKGVIIVQ
jgi:plastocyanin